MGGGPLLIEVFEEKIAALGGLLLRNTRVCISREEREGRVTGCIACGEDGKYLPLERQRAASSLRPATSAATRRCCRPSAPIALNPAMDHFWPETSNAGDGHRDGLLGRRRFDDAPWACVMHNTPTAASTRSSCTSTAAASAS
jgi:hypothetical protein